MINIKQFTFLVLILCSAASVRAQNPGGNPSEMEWTVDGIVREALVYVPPNAFVKAAPLVFVFHGHGGSMTNALQRFRIHEHWADAIVVYPQGLNTPGKLIDPTGEKRGWQNDSGNMNDRDVKFFDTMLASLKEKFKIDERRIYATGHSNGGLFTYLLWATRANVFAAMAPSSAVALQVTGLLQPKPALHLMGERDPLVTPALQKLMCEAVLQINGCSAAGKKLDRFTTLFESSTGHPLVVYIHPGGHKLPDDVGKTIAEFFKHQKKVN